MFDRLPFGGKLAVIAVLAVGVLAAAYFVYPNIKEMNEQIVTLEDDWTAKDRKMRNGQAIEARLEEFESEVAGLELKLADLSRILPREAETGDLLRWIKNLGDESNLDLKSFAPGSLQPVEFYKEFPIGMRVVGRYHDLGIFLDRVSKYSRIINVDKLSMKRFEGTNRERDKTITAEFTATTFVYEEEEVNP
jgi:type IV pilus assembly protein PilO